MRTKTVMLVLAEVTKKNGEVVPVTVPAYELAVLRAAFGPQQVKIVNPEYDALVIEDNAFTEYRRMCQKYDNKNTGVVTMAYRDEDDFAQRSGLTLDFDIENIAEKPLAEKVDNEAVRQARVAEAKGAAKNKGGRPRKDAAEPLGEAAA